MEAFWIAAAVAVISWTLAKEEIFRELREALTRLSEEAPGLFTRKAAYMVTCEFCLSFWVSLAGLAVFRHQVAYLDWRGYGLALFVTWALANAYMTAYSMLRVDIRRDKIEIKKEEFKLQDLHDSDGRLAHSPSDSP